MKRSFAVVRVGLVLALAQACAPSSSTVPSQRSLAVRALVDLEAGTQVTRVGIYALRLAADGSVRSSWGEETDAHADGPYAAPVDVWPALDLERGDSVHVTVVAYGPNASRQLRALGARHVTVVVGAPQWLRTELEWPDFGNVVDHDAGLALVQDAPSGPLSFDPRARFTVQPTGTTSPSPLAGNDLPPEQCVDLSSCLGTPSGLEPACSERSCEADAQAFAPTAVVSLPDGRCRLSLPAQVPSYSTPILTWSSLALPVPSFALSTALVARLGRDYEATETELLMSSRLCAAIAAQDSSTYGVASVACDVSPESPPARCRSSAVRRQPTGRGSKFVLPARPQDNFFFGELSLPEPPTSLVAATGTTVLVAIASPSYLVVRRASRYYEGFQWAPALLTDFAGPVRPRALHAVGGPGAEPRLFFSGTDGVVYGPSGDRWNEGVSFCEENAGCTTQAEVVGAVSATARHEALWVLRTGSGLSVYRNSGADRADRIDFPGLTDVARVLEPIDFDAGIALVVARPSGGWDLLQLDPASARSIALPLQTALGTEGELLHLAQGASEDRPAENVDAPHVLTATGEYRLVLGPAHATLAPVRLRESVGASWYGRGAAAWYPDGREACSLHAMQLRCWRPELEDQTLDGVFAATFFDEFRGAVVAAGPGAYTLDLRYFGPTFP